MGGRLPYWDRWAVASLIRTVGRSPWSRCIGSGGRSLPLLGPWAVASLVRTRCQLGTLAHAHWTCSRRAASASSAERARVRGLSRARARRARRAMTERDVSCHVPRDTARGVALPPRPPSKFAHQQDYSRVGRPSRPAICPSEVVPAPNPRARPRPPRWQVALGTSRSSRRQLTRVLS